MKKKMKHFVYWTALFWLTVNQANAQDSAIIKQAKISGIEEYAVIYNSKRIADYRFTPDGNLLAYVSYDPQGNKLKEISASYGGIGMPETSEEVVAKELIRYFYDSNSILYRKELADDHTLRIYYFGHEFEARSTYYGKSTPDDSTYTQLWPNGNPKEVLYYQGGWLRTRQRMNPEGNLIRFEDLQTKPNTIKVNEYSEEGKLIQSDEFSGTRLLRRKKWYWVGEKLMRVTLFVKYPDADEITDYNVAPILNKEITIEQYVYNESDSLLEATFFTEYGDTSLVKRFEYGASNKEATTLHYARNQLYTMEKEISVKSSDLLTIKRFYYDMPSMKFSFGTGMTFSKGRLVGKWKYADENDSGVQTEKWVYENDTIIFHLEVSSPFYRSETTLDYREGLLHQSKNCRIRIDSKYCEKRVYEYNDRGNMTSEKFYQGDSLSYVYTYSYLGDQLSEKVKSQNGKVATRVIFTYDERKNLTSRIEYRGDPKPTNEFIYQIKYY